MSVPGQFIPFSNSSMLHHNISTGMVEKMKEMIEFCATPDFRSQTLDYQKGYLEASREVTDEMYLQLNRSLEEEVEELEGALKYLRKRT